MNLMRYINLKIYLWGEIAILSLLPTGWLLFASEPPGLADIVVFMLFCAFVEARHRIYPAADLGSLGFSGFTRGWWLIVVAVALTIAMVLMGFRNPRVYKFDEFAILTMLLWCLVQNFVLTSCYRRLLAMYPAPSAVLVTSFLFGLLHIPNLPLMALTLVMSIIVLTHFHHYRSIWIISLFHFITKLALSVCLPPEWLGYFTVGKRFVELAKVVNLPKFVTWLLNG